MDNKNATTPSGDNDIWTNDLSVLWRNGNYVKFIPNSTQARPELINAIARLSIIAGIVFAFLFRSFTPIGLGLLGLFASSRMTTTASIPQAPVVEPTTSRGAHVQRKRKSKEHKKHGTKLAPSQDRQKNTAVPQYPQYKQGLDPANKAPVSWNDMFGSSMDSTTQQPATNSAMGAYVSLSNQQQPQISYFPLGNGNPAEGSHTENMVPPQDVTQFQSGNVTMRTPFPHPNNSGSPFAQSSPFQAGFPTAFGPAPTAIPPTAGSATRDFAAGAANQLIGPDAFQPSDGPVGFGAFASDGGFTSGPTTPVVPHATLGSNFPTMTYQPHNLAPAGPALPLPAQQQCFPANAENLLGNPSIAENRVARPPLCAASDPRSDSQQFLNQLYEAPGQISSGYQFFPFPVQDVVEARENFQKFVYQDGQTHFKDKYSGENVGIYNITDQIGPLGF